MGWTSGLQRERLANGVWVAGHNHRSTSRWSHTASTCAQYTYVLSKALYVPLTSWSDDAVSLPATRGPGFTLPAHVVASLCRVRDAEQASLFEYEKASCVKHLSQEEEQAARQKPSNPPVQWEPWCKWLDTQVGYHPLPPPHKSSIRVKDSTQINPATWQTELRQLFSATEEKGQLRPSVAELVEETLQQIGHGSSPNDIMRDSEEGFGLESVVLAGEGEPLLRLSSALKFLSQLQERANQKGTKLVPLRIVTNGLACTKSRQDANDPHVLASQLHDAGLTSISIALQTNDPLHYETVCLKTDSTITGTEAHEEVCEFVRACVGAGIDTETTAVEHPNVDRGATEKLSESLGVTTPVRWRPFYP